MNYRERLRSLGCQPTGLALQYAQHIYTLVSRSPILENRSLEEIKRLTSYMDVWTTAGPVTVITEGEPGDFMVLVIKGSVQVLKQDNNGASRRIATVQPGETLGEMSMLDGEPRFASCCTNSASTFAVLHRDGFIRLVQEEPVLGSRILLKLNQLLSQRLRQTGVELVAYMQAYQALRSGSPQ